MRLLLRPDFRSGPFGDPALYVRELGAKGAVLIDCGDLSRYSPAELLRVHHICLSHCHIDHFFGFDLFLRIHVGIEKSTMIIGPPDTSARVNGKLQGYTWNLIRDKNMEFVVADLDTVAGTKTITVFHSRDAFKPSAPRLAPWNRDSPVFDTGYYQVRATTLDHRTPSMAYAIEEKKTVGVNAAAIAELNLKPGPWIDALKRYYLFDFGTHAEIAATDNSGTVRHFPAEELVTRLLIPRQRHKLAYMTDAMASEGNRERILKLVSGADVLYSETCFLEEDRTLADETRHFTAAFVGTLAREASVKQLVPFHFSKRYIDRPELVLTELARTFGQPIEPPRLAPAHGTPGEFHRAFRGPASASS